MKHLKQFMGGPENQKIFAKILRTFADDMEAGRLRLVTMDVETLFEELCSPFSIPTITDTGRRKIQIVLLGEVSNSQPVTAAKKRQPAKRRSKRIRK